MDVRKWGGHPKSGNFLGFPFGGQNPPNSIYKAYLRERVKHLLTRVLNSEILAKPNGEPVENFSNGHKSNPQAKSAETTEAGDEVQPSHLWQSLKFWEIHFITGFQ